jgi:hypothetical protein
MALGDGIRRNIATVEPDERRRLRDAFIALNKRFYGGNTDDQQFGFPVPGGVSFWFKQDEIHARSGVHGSPAFLPWHRELCNRLEALLREEDPELSLHYWDWTTDPRKQVAPNGEVFNLFTEDFMGIATGRIGDPWQQEGFYDPCANLPTAANPNPVNPARSNRSHDPMLNASQPPKSVNRSVDAGTPGPVTIQFAKQQLVSDPNTVNDIVVDGMLTDADVIFAENYPTMRGNLEALHNLAHGFIAGTIGNPHTSFRDPFVFLIHSNVDRLFALWQLQPGNPDRLEPAKVYGTDATSEAKYDDSTQPINGHDFVNHPDEVSWGILTPLLPWSGFEFEALDSVGNRRTLAVIPVRPWAAPENEHLGHSKNCMDPSVVSPPKYDTNP